MEVVDVNVIRVHALQAGIAALHDVFSAQTPVVGAVTHGIVDLSRQNPVVPMTADELSDDSLRLATTIAISRIYEVHAGLPGMGNDRSG